MATINVLKEQPTRCAPYAFFAECIATDLGIDPGPADDYDPAFHDIEYRWTITKDGDPAWTEAAYSAPQNLPAAFRLKGTKYGQRIAHVFDEPGTYRVGCVAQNIATGDEATAAEQVVEVADPDRFFRPAETFIVTSDGDHTGIPANAGSFSLLWQASDAAHAAIAAGKIDKYRIRVKRGTSYDQGFNAPYVPVKAYMIDTWGDPQATKPVFSTGRLALMNQRAGETCTSVQIRDIRWEGGDGIWEGYQINEPVVAIQGYERLGNDLMRWVRGDHATVPQNSWIAFADCICEDWTSTPLLSGAPSKSMALIGCRWTMDPNLHADAVGAGGFGPRVSGLSELLYVSQCDGFNRAGRDGNTPGISTTQGVLRVGTNYNLDGQRIIIERCGLEGGGVSWGNVGSPPSVSRVLNLLIERNMMTGTHDGAYAFNGGSTGVTIRNNQRVQPPSRSANSYAFGTWVRIQPFDPGNVIGSTDPKVIAAPVNVYNNTLISLKDRAAPSFFFTPINFSMANFSAWNNAVHHPFASGTPLDAGPFVLTKVAASRYLGYFDSDTPLIPDTITPGRFIEYQGQTAPFTEGSTLSGSVSGATATICQNFNNGATGRLWLTDVAGTFQAGETLTDVTGGSATATGADEFSGVIGLWEPDEGSPLLGAVDETQIHAITDFWGKKRPFPASKGAFEAGF